MTPTDPRALERLRELVALDRPLPKIAELMGWKQQRVRNVMQAYAIRRPVRVSVPPAPLHKLMGGR